MECRLDEYKTDAPQLLDLKFHRAQERGKCSKSGSQWPSWHHTRDALFSSYEHIFQWCGCLYLNLFLAAWSKQLLCFLFQDHCELLMVNWSAQQLTKNTAVQLKPCYRLKPNLILINSFLKCFCHLPGVGGQLQLHPVFSRSLWVCTLGCLVTCNSFQISLFNTSFKFARCM